MILSRILLFLSWFHYPGRIMGLLLLTNLCFATEIRAGGGIVKIGVYPDPRWEVSEIAPDGPKKTAQEEERSLRFPFGTFSADTAGLRNDRNHAFLRNESTILLISVSLFIVILTGAAIFLKKSADRKNIALLAEIRERKKLEKCLIDSRQAYRKLVDNLPHRIFLKNRDSVYMQCNRAYADDLGIPVNTIAGRTDSDFFSPKKSKKYLQHDQKVIQTDTVMEYEDDYFADHTFSIVKIAKFPIHGDDGEVTGILGIIWDITREKMAEKALLESEQQFRSLIDQASDAVTIADMKGKIIDANVKACESLGYTCEELLALHMNVVDPVVWSSHTPPSIWRDLSENRAVIMETDYHSKNGSTFPVEVSMSLHKESGSNLVLNIARDITPRHLALKQRASMGRIIEDSLSETYILSSDNLHFMMANRGARENIGYSAEELKVKTITDICPGLTKEVFHNLVAPLDTKDKERVRLETIFLRRDTTTYPVDIFIQFTEYLFYPVYVLQAVDLSERKKYEQELQHAVDIINKSSSVAFIWQKAEGLPVTFVTRNVQQIFGYSAEDLLSQKKAYTQLIHPDDYDAYMAEIESGARDPNQKIIDHCSYRILTSGNEIKWVSDYTYIKRDQQGNIVFYQGIVEDITGHKRMEQQLFQAEKMTTIAGLAAGVAHEINTPLSAILQSIEVVRNALDDGCSDNLETAGECGLDLEKLHHYFKEKELDFYLDGIRTSALNASRIITNLLDFSRPQKGDLQEVDINQLMDNSLDLARADYDLKKKYDILHIEVKKEYGASLPMVRCVPMEIEQVILNLIKNAVHAMVDGAGTKNPCITFMTRQEGDAIRIEVRDNGPGMEESVQKHIFDPFFTTKEPGMGTGLGLSVSYAIMHDKHHGDIRVESKTGQGATFVLLLPLRQEV